MADSYEKHPADKQVLDKQALDKQGCGLASGCKTAGMGFRLREAGLRPTRQRLTLGALLFGSGDRHLSAEMLHVEALNSGEQVSLATVYNTLHQFQEAGLLREVAVDASRSYFDTDTSDHHHFYLEDEQRVIDIPPNSIVLKGLPDAPRGMEVTHVDVVVRVRKVRV